MSELQNRKDQIQAIKDTGQYFIDNADKIDFFICYAAGSPTHKIRLQYMNYYGSWEEVIGASTILSLEIEERYFRRSED